MNAASLTEAEEQLVNQLVRVFTGVQIEGKSGFVNLVKVKESFFRNALKMTLSKFLSSNCIDDSNKQIIYSDVFDFFQAHFSITGSIHYDGSKDSKPPIFLNDSTKEVSLIWTTKSLYYVKTDKLWRSSTIRYSKEDISFTILFDVSDMRHKSRNEKKHLNFSLKSVTSDEIVFEVSYSSRRKTDLEGICSTLNEHGIFLDKSDLESVFKAFKRQRTAEYFIHKNAQEFLNDQLSLWIYSRFYSEGISPNLDDEHRIQLFRSLATSIIKFIGQFEDFLVAIWNKPKFVLNSNYVITLDRIANQENGKQVLKSLAIQPAFDEQVKEWICLGLIDESEMEQVSELMMQGNIDDSKYCYLPIDTCFFDAAFKQSVLALFDHLDSSIDGWLIHSENYQALNTILAKFREQVKLIYIDPPFNLGTDSNFKYNVNYADAVWLTLLENRLVMAREFLEHDGSIFVRCDHNGNMYVRLLLNETFGPENFRNEIVIRRGSSKAGLFNQFKEQKSLGVVYDNIYWFSKSPNSSFSGFMGSPTKRQREGYWSSFKKIYDRPTMRYEILGVNITEGQWMWKKEKAMKAVENYQDFLREHEATGISLRKHWEKTGKKLAFVRRRGNAIQYWVAPRETVLLENCWTDISGYSSLWGFKTENSEVLLKRIIESTSSKGDLVMDFFLGSGTTIAVAHKLGRRWIGIEMGDHFHSVVISRMKHVLAYDKKGISKQVPEYQGGGFFKYYELEQYDQCLSKAKCSEGRFSRDLYSLGISTGSNDAIEWNKIQDGIDVSETLSNLLGSKISQIGIDGSVLEDGSIFSLDSIEVSRIAPLILILN